MRYFEYFSFQDLSGRLDPRGLEIFLSVGSEDAAVLGRWFPAGSKTLGFTWCREEGRFYISGRKISVFPAVELSGLSLFLSAGTASLAVGADLQLAQLLRKATKMVETGEPHVHIIFLQSDPT